MDLLELAAKLVSFDTVSQESSTEAIASFVANYLEMQGFQVSWFEYESINEQSSEKSRLRKVNLVARKGEVNRKSRLALSGHLDTVPYMANKWHTDPLNLTLRNSRYYGMGIADMKLFDAIMMMVGSLVNERELKSPFCLYFTSDEEIGCVGVKKMVGELEKRGEHVADYVIVGEPTELHPQRLHKGYMYFRISIERWRDTHQVDFEELSAHSSKPNQLTNVVEKVLPRVIDAVAQFKQRLESVQDISFIPPYPTMNIGGSMRMHAAAAKNIIPGYIAIDNEIRTIPGQDPFELIELLRMIIQEAIQDIVPIADEQIHVDIDWMRVPTPPMSTPETSKIVREIENLSRRKAGSVSYNTEGGIFNASGAQSVIWGPASIAQAHKDNEFADLRWFRPDVIEQYMTVIRRICNE